MSIIVRRVVDRFQGKNTDDIAVTFYHLATALSGISEDTLIPGSTEQQLYDLLHEIVEKSDNFDRTTMKSPNLARAHEQELSTLCGRVNAIILGPDTNNPGLQEIPYGSPLHDLIKAYIRYISATTGATVSSFANTMAGWVGISLTDKKQEAEALQARLNQQLERELKILIETIEQQLTLATALQQHQCNLARLNSTLAQLARASSDNQAKKTTLETLRDEASQETTSLVSLKQSVDDKGIGNSAPKLCQVMYIVEHIQEGTLTAAHVSDEVLLAHGAPILRELDVAYEASFQITGASLAVTASRAWTGMTDLFHQKARSETPAQALRRKLQAYHGHPTIVGQAWKKLAVSSLETDIAGIEAQADDINVKQERATQMQTFTASKCKEIKDEMREVQQQLRKHQNASWWPWHHWWALRLNSDYRDLQANLATTIAKTQEYLEKTEHDKDLLESVITHLTVCKAMAVEEDKFFYSKKAAQTRSSLGQIHATYFGTARERELVSEVAIARVQLVQPVR